MNGIKYRFADEMKDSGIEWIGKIPREWTTKRIKTIGEVKNGATPQSTNEMYWDGNIEWFTPTDMVYLDLLSSKRKLTKRGLMSCGTQLVSKDSILISCRAPIGKLGIIRSVLSTFNQGCKSITVRSEDYKYSYYCIASSVDQLVALGKGTTFMELSGPDLSNFKIPCPDILVQRKIANFLDIKTAQFDSIIAKKEQLIAKLEEAKKSLISEVVTGKVKIVDGQLVPRQPEEMKDSGVEWLGMIPKEWSVRKFSHVIAIANGQVDPRISPFKEMILIAPNHIESNTGRILNLQSAEDQSADSGKYFCDKGDVIYSKIRPALCKACIAPMDCLTSADMYPMKADKKLLMNEWFLMILLSDNFTSAVILDSDRVAMPKVNRDSLSSYKLPVPSLLEQKSILSLIMTKQCEMDSVLEKTNFQIALLKSAKQSLISEAVTGKIDLRDWEIIEQGGAS